MKLTRGQLRKIWILGDVKNIPQGWRRIVYYDKKEKKFWGMLIASPTEINSPELVKVGEFISLRDYIRKEIPDIFKVTDEEALEYYEHDFMNGYYYPPAQWTF